MESVTISEQSNYIEKSAHLYSRLLIYQTYKYMPLKSQSYNLLELVLNRILCEQPEDVNPLPEIISLRRRNAAMLCKPF